MTWAEIVITNVDEFGKVIRRGDYASLVESEVPVKIILPSLNITICFPSGILSEYLRNLHRQLTREKS